jgi:hypothetical protein
MIYDFRKFARIFRINPNHKSKMIIGLLQLNSTIGDFAANREKLLAGYEKAVALRRGICPRAGIVFVRLSAARPAFAR